MRTISLLLTLSAITGCGGLDEARVEQAGAGENCLSSLCGNSPEVPYMGFHELSLSGVPNEEEISIETFNGRAQIRKGPAKYDLVVQKGKLFGLSSGMIVLSGQSLVGADIVLMKGSEPLYAIHVHGVRENIPLPLNQPGKFDAYHFTRHAVGKAPDPGEYLCNGPMLFPEQDQHYKVFLGMENYETLLFERDRVRRAELRMELAPDPDWFNFGCAGRTLAKLHLTGHTCAAQGSDCTKEDRWATRQAVLKMLAADYCGTGRAFTVSGTPLVWKGGNVAGFADNPVDIEARWTEQGAACIGRPRLEAYPDPGGLYPEGIPAALATYCEPSLIPPPCADPDFNAFDGALIVSANRPEQT